MHKNTKKIALASLLLAGGGSAVAGYSELWRRTTVRSASIDHAAKERTLKASRLVTQADRLLKDRQDLALAVTRYRESLSIADTFSVRVGLVSALMAQGRTLEARTTLEGLLDRIRTGRVGHGSKDLSVVLKIAEACEKLGLIQEAHSIYATLGQGPMHQIDARFRLPELDQDPKHLRTNAVFAVAVSTLRTHHNEEATHFFKEVVRERPDWGVARFMLAYAHAYAGNEEEAAQGFSEAARFGFSRPEGL